MSTTSAAAQVRSRVPRIAGAAVEQARLRVVPRVRRRAPKVPFVLLVSALMLGGVVGLLMFNTSMQQASFATTTLEQRAGSLKAREQALAAELEELRNPQRLAAAARRQGMVSAPAPAFLLPDGTVEGTATAAGPDGERIHELPPPVPSELDPKPVYVDPPADGRGDGRAAGQGDGRGDSRGDTTAGSTDGGRGEGRNGTSGR